MSMKRTCAISSAISFLTSAGILFARIVRRFCSYIKPATAGSSCGELGAGRTEDRGQRTEDRGQRTEVRGQRSEQPSVQLMLMLMLMLVIVIEIPLATNNQRPTPNIQNPIEEVRGRRSDVRNPAR